MSRSQSVRAAFLLRRMHASRLLIGCVLLATLVTSTLLAGLADFSAVFLNQAAKQQVASSGKLAVQVNSTASAAQAGRANRFVTTSLRSAFGAQGLVMQSALWSDPLGLPTPAGTGSQWTAEVASMGGIGKHVRLVAGAWPRAGQPGGPYAVAVPAGDAGKLSWRPGQSLTLTDADNGSQVQVQISGVYRIEDPAARYWGLDLISTSGVSVQAGFSTFGPLLTSAGTFAPGRLPVGQRSWLAIPVRAEIPPGSMPPLAGRVQQAVIRLGQSQGFGGIVASSGMPQLLTATAASYEVARALLVIGGLELLLVAGAALALTAHLLASDREAESALLAARGLTRRQIGLLTVVEAVTAATVAAAAGVVLGGLLARLLASVSSVDGLRPTAAALSLAGLRAGWWPAIVVVVLATVVLGWPSASSATAAGQRARSGRPTVVATVSRASVDVAVLALAALTAWQLRDYSAVAHGASGALGVDPVLAVAPALILAGLALIPLRLMPAAARLADRLATRGSRLTAALAAWQLSRRPMRQAGPALLAILAVGASTVALAEEQSWHESIRAQAAAIVGADARADVPPAASGSVALAAVTARNVRAAMPVTAFNGGLPGQVIALDAGNAARVVQLRPDQAPLPAGRLWRLITPPTRPDGLLVPGRATRLGLQASLGTAPASWGLGVLTVSLSVQAADGVVVDLPAGALPADGQTHLLTAGVPAVDRVSYPLRLVGVTLTYQLPPVPTGSVAASVPHRQVALTISGFAASARPAGPLPRFAPGAAIGAWSRAAASATLASNDKASGVEPAIGRWIASGSGVTAVVTPGDGQLVPLPGLPPVPVAADVALAARPGQHAIPGIVTTSFASANSVGVGSDVVAAVGSYNVPVHVVAEVSSFPTVGTGSALIIDQQAVQGLLAAVSAPPLAVTSWWLATSTGGPPTGVRTGPLLTSLSQVTARMLDNPIGAAPQQIALAVAVAVAILATLGFAVSVAASLKERRASSALLAAIGVSRRARARQLCLEQVVLAAPAAAVGLLAGAAIARLLIPAVTLTAAATRPTPPALVYLPLGRALALAAVVAAVPVVAAAVTVLSRPDPAAELRAMGTS